VTFVVELPIVDLRALLEQHCLREVAVTRQAKREVCVALFSALNLAGVLICKSNSIEIDRGKNRDEQYYFILCNNTIGIFSDN
jgi:hypothetical protein